MHAELGSKLSWQNTGPYRVLASQKHGREYRLQHLATGDICIHSATDLHPYLVTQGFDDLTVEQKKELIPQAKPVDPGSRVSSIQDVKPGQYMWLLPSARLFDSDEQGYLVRVAQRYPSRNQVQVHVLNTRSKCQRSKWPLSKSVDLTATGLGESANYMSVE